MLHYLSQSSDRYIKTIEFPVTSCLRQAVKSLGLYYNFHCRTCSNTAVPLFSRSKHFNSKFSIFALRDFNITKYNKFPFYPYLPSSQYHPPKEEDYSWSRSYHILRQLLPLPPPNREYTVLQKKRSCLSQMGDLPSVVVGAIPNNLPLADFSYHIRIVKFLALRFQNLIISVLFFHLL